MEIFPRKGIELSADAEVLFDDVEYYLPAVVVEFENGTKERSARFPTGSYNTGAHVRCSQADWQVIIDFLLARQLCVEPFLIHHPFLTGSEGAVVNYVSDRLPAKRIIRGDPNWFELDLRFEGRL